jgi:DNA-directed RNA polymerase specialized sigma24 family protein
VPVDEVDDVVQETALRLFAAWGRVFEDQPVRPLVTTIALNVARDLHRRERTRPRFVPVLPDLRDENLSVDRTALARLEVSRTAKAMSAMPAARRQVLARAVTEELAGEEVGRHRAPAAFRMALTRARRELATAVELAGCLMGALIVVLKRGARAPATHATALTAIGAGLVVAIAPWSAPSGAPVGTIAGTTTRPQPANISAAAAIAPGAGMSSWSGAPLSLGSGSGGSYEGLSQWVAPSLSGGSWWRGGSGVAAGGAPACALRILYSSVEYPCGPVV